MTRLRNGGTQASINARQEDAQRNRAWTAAEKAYRNAYDRALRVGSTGAAAHAAGEAARAEVWREYDHDPESF